MLPRLDLTPCLTKQELHVGDIPDGELATILEKRCAVAPSYATKLVASMRELQRRRQVTYCTLSPLPRLCCNQLHTVLVSVWSNFKSTVMLSAALVSHKFWQVFSVSCDMSWADDRARHVAPMTAFREC